MDHAAVVGLVVEEEPVIVLTLVIHLASNADAVVVNAVCGDDLDASAVRLSDDVLNSMRACVTYGYSSLRINSGSVMRNVGVVRLRNVCYVGEPIRSE